MISIFWIKILVVNACKNNSLDTFAKKSNFTEQPGHSGHLRDVLRLQFLLTGDGGFCVGTHMALGKVTILPAWWDTWPVQICPFLHPLGHSSQWGPGQSWLSQSKVFLLGLLRKTFLPFSERVLCGWDSCTLNRCSPERIHPEDKMKPRTWQGRQSQGSEPPRIIGSHCAQSLPTSGIFLDCWIQVALISLSSWDVSPNHPGSVFTFYGNLWGSGLKVWELSRWCLECPG